MLQNPIFLEIVIKEKMQTFDKEAEISRLLKSAKSNNQRKQFNIGIEKFANLLILIGEYLKRKYCPKPTGTTESSAYLSQDTCRC